MNRKLKYAGAAAAAAALALPAYAGAHAVVSTLQPQGDALTARRTAYVLRVPNERDRTDTYKVVLNVPEAVQEAISVRTLPGWKVTRTRKDTGKRNEEGGKIFAVTKITWTAKSRDDRIPPGFYGEFYFRFQNPATAQTLCFPTLQYYTPERRGGRSEIVRWTGAPESETPASCVQIKEAPAS